MQTNLQSGGYIHVHVVFRRLHNLTVTTIGDGTVTGLPGSVTVGPDASQTAEIDHGQTVTLVAAPSAGRTFAGWSGACSGTGPCQVQVNNAANVTATFTYPLTIRSQGTGTGSVQGAPGSIFHAHPSAAQDYQVPAGSSLALVAVTDPGTTFVGWINGPCAGDIGCNLTMDGPKDVTALFNDGTYTLTVVPSGAGVGTILMDPPGSAYSLISKAFAPGTVITLTPTPALGSTFGSWIGGPCNGQTGPCTFTMPAAAVGITAGWSTFGRTFAVTNAGGGSVASNDGLVTCGPPGTPGNTCSQTYLLGQPASITFTATPQPGATFVGWTGGCGGTSPCTLANSTGFGARYVEVTATFAWPLTVSKTGAGTGCVQSTGGAIICGDTCGTTCSLNLQHGSTVTLNATPGPNSVFTGWGGACSGTGSCMVGVSGVTNITANFAIAQHVLTVGRSGLGGVASSPPGIACNSTDQTQTCTASYNHGTVVTLTPTPAPGYRFERWTGVDACAGNGPCMVTMNDVVNIGAAFVQDVYIAAVTSTSGGHVIGSAGGINCPGSCAGIFTPGQSVTLTATPDPGYVFSGWGGDCSGTGPCTMSMTANRSASASFAVSTGACCGPTGSCNVQSQLSCTGSGYSFLGNASSCQPNVCPLPCTLTCPGNIAQPSEPNVCGATVAFAGPTIGGNCLAVVSSVGGIPITSPHFFPTGVTTVTCTSTDSVTGSPVTCSFTVTINDTQPPTITCPANIVASTDPGQCGANLAFSAPTVGDNCSGGALTTAISAGARHSLALRSDGQVVTWGDSIDGLAAVPARPVGVTYTAVSAGVQHSLALRSDGQVVAWGGTDPTTGTPALAAVPSLPVGVTYTAVAAGAPFNVALRSDGFAVTWGDFSLAPGLGTVPFPGVNRTYTAVAAGLIHSLALRSDGQVVGWGSNAFGQTSVPALPVGVTYTAIAAGGAHNLALRSDGQVVAWGDDTGGLAAVPPLPMGVTYTAVAAGVHHNLALRSDGQVVTWGSTANGLGVVPPLPSGVLYTAVAGGGFHSLALRSDGQAVAWGGNDYGQTTVPPATALVCSVANQPITSPHFFPTGVTTVSCTATDSSLNTATCSFTVTVTNASPIVITGQPTGQTVCPGASTSLSVVASGGGGTLTYQWRKAGDPLVDQAGHISGAATNVLTITNANSADTAVYYCTVSGPCGSLNSSPASILVSSPLLITGQPSPATVCPGQSATFSVAATGPAPITFQWRKGTINIPGATGSSLTINPAVLADAATYDCVVTNPCGFVTSIGAALTVRTPVSFTTQPQNTSACVGGSATFSVAVSAIPAPTGYQWRKDTINIPGAAATTLNIFGVNAGSVASYDCVVSHLCGQATSNAASLTVNTPISITGSPVNTTVCAGTPATFTVTATGTISTYQWRKGTINIPGATTSSFTIPSAAAGDSGAYDCVITGPCNTATSGGALLTIQPATTVLQQPTSLSVCAGTSSASFFATGSGQGTVTYQWRKSTVPIPGATTGTLTISHPTAASADDYDCVISAFCGSVTTNTATLSVNTAPTITTQPASQAACLGFPATFSIAASGVGTFTYQWYKGGASIPGATSPSYTIPSVTFVDGNAQYACTVTDSCGSAPSAAVNLFIRDPITITSQPTPANGCVGGSTSFIIFYNNSSVPSIQWRRAGVPIPGATSDVLTINPVLATDGVSYDCVLTNPCGSVTSTSVALTLLPSTAITMQPSAQSTCAGGSTSFAVTATGNSLTYQWKRGTTSLVNGGHYNGAFSPALFISNAAVADVGTYTCVVSGACGSSTSNGAALTLDGATSITQQPVSITGCAGSSVTLSVVATGGSPLTYQWLGRADTTPTPIPGATSANLTLSPISSGNNGVYSVVVTSPCGSVTSTIVTVTGIKPPLFNTQPIGGSVCRLGLKTLTAAASDSPNYQWRKNGVNISGATSPSLTIGPALASDAATYDCVATISPCPGVPSNPAVVTVCLPDFNCDGQRTVADIFAFLSGWFAHAPAADFTGDNQIMVADIFAFLSAWFAGCP